MKNRKHAVIIGAGPAGLTAAYELLTKTDILPIVIEESPFMGGISRTANYKGNRMDLGGHRFFSKDKRVTDFWQMLLPTQGAPSSDDIITGNQKPLAQGGPDPEKEDKVMLVRTRVSRIFYLRKFFDYPISMKAETFKNMGFGRTVKSGFGYVKSCIVKKPETNLKNFYINRFGKPLYEMFFEDYTEKLWGVNPENISADWGAQRVKGLSLRKALMSMLKKDKTKTETSLIEQFVYPKKGPGQLWETLADKVAELGGIILTDTKALGVVSEGNKITGVRVLREGKESVLDCDYVLSSMPVKDLVEGFDAAPEDVRQIAAALPYRDFITVGLLLDRLLLQNKTNMKTVGNIVPDCWIYVQERDVKIGRLQIFNNWSPYMVADPQNTVFMGLEYFCNEGDDMWNMAAEDFINFAIDELVKIDIIRREDVKDSVCIKVKKAYPAYFGAYSRFDRVREFLDGFDNLFCIGRNGQHRYNNMDHSMLTAMEAVDAIARGSTDKKAVWEVNTEKEYHETAKSEEN
ncbi:MAG: NAD(P)/FAD-dependent oxidoreductase [Ruminococcaceae bacterium]|nr:NAD(P)/FAD-dependent oxidoreductase [Oscillospiraceae bacterium]